MVHTQKWQNDMLLFDDVRLIKMLGHGGMGQVWLGQQLSWDQPVAIKQSLSSDSLKLSALEKEADMWLEAGLHPYITTCYYTRRMDDQTVIILEYANQGSLSQWIHNEKLYESNALYDITRFGLQAAWGLACAHRIKLLHLDVKPDNILINNDQAKISDFGLSKVKGLASQASGFTLRYAAPEQLSRKTASEKTDVYSWAVSILAMAAGGAFWADGSLAAEALKEYSDQKELRVSLPGRARSLLMHCLNQNPEMRPTMEQVGDELTEIMKACFPELPIPEKLIDRHPLSSAEYNNRAIYLFEKGEKDEAIHYFKKAEAIAMEVAIPRYNHLIADFYCRKVTPAQIIETFKGSILKPERYEEKKISAQLMMLNGDLRTLQKNPELIASSAQVQDWIQNSAIGHLQTTESEAPIYMKPDDKQKIYDILTSGRLDSGLLSQKVKEPYFPLNTICSAKRKTYLMDNDKGAFLLGGINSGENPWLSCIIRQERYKLDVTFFMGEHAVYIENAPKPICYFKDPQNIQFFNFPDIPALRSLGASRFMKYESMDDVCALSIMSDRGKTVALILNLTNGVSAKNSVLIESYRGGELSFRKDGALLIEGRDIIEPEAWNGKKRKTNDPMGFAPSNNTDIPDSKVFINFGQTHLLLKHSDRYIKLDDSSSYEYSCLWDYSPYRYLSALFDHSPASGATLVFEHQGTLLTTRIDRTPENPPAHPQWLMMRAVSGAVAVDRQDLLIQLTADYEDLLKRKEYHRIESITHRLRPLVLQSDVQALALWKTIAQAFPKGKPIMAIQLEKENSHRFEHAYTLKYPRPKYPGLSFSIKTAIGSVRYVYDHTRDHPIMTCIRSDGHRLTFECFADYPYTTVVSTSSDGLLQLLISGKMRYGEKPTIYGFVIRIVDIRRMEVLFEKEYPILSWNQTFAFWNGHVLFFYLNGLHAIHLDKKTEKFTDLPDPLIQSQVEIHNPEFLEVQADYFTSGHLTWYICSEILPIPQEPLSDPRYVSIKKMLPFLKKRKKEMMLKNGFGTIWTKRIWG